MARELRAVAHMLDAARAATEAEGRLAERYENKARGQATLAGSWFAVTQAIALASTVAHISKGWIICLLIGLVAQALSLCVLLESTAQVWELRAEEDVSSESSRRLGAGGVRCS